MKTTAVQFKLLLPALQHLAKFPGANVDHVCRMRGCDKDEVLAAIRDMAGVISMWDEESLAERARDFGVTVPAYRPLNSDDSARNGGPSPFNSRGDKLAAADQVAKSAPKPIAAPAAAVPEAKRGPKLRAAAGKPPKKAPRGEGRRTKDYHAVCRLLLADADLSAAQACSKVGVKSGSWAFFKKKIFGLGPINRKVLQRFVAQIDGQPEPRMPAVKVDVLQAPVPAPAAIKPDDGWKELDLSLARSTGFLARYSAIGGGLLSLTRELRELARRAGHPIERPGRIMLRWHPGRQQLALLPNPTTGLLIQGGADKAHVLRGRPLRKLLGEEVLVFTRSVDGEDNQGNTTIILTTEGGAA